VTYDFETDFQIRKQQVRHYLAILVAIEKMTRAGRSTPRQNARLLTARAGAFLLLYNLVEASMRSAIQEIHDRIAVDSVPFEALTPSLKREAMRRFKLAADPEQHHGTTDLPSAFVAIALEGGVDMAGNVDARHIRALSKVYGFSLDVPDHTWGGSDLVIIKSARNDLAHGHVTFADLGRDYGIDRIREISLRSLGYMRAILGNVSIFLEQKRYLQGP
jgi:hypothetical protein